MQVLSEFQPWCAVEPLPEAWRWEVRRRAIFECCKWDPQVEDVDTLAPVALVLNQAVWTHLACAAEILSAEVLEAEQELARRPDTHRSLSIPRRVRAVLGNLPDAQNRAEDVRVMRFDFHPSSEGWRVSEVNSDVPGGYNEASGLTGIVAEQIPGAVPCGDPAERLVEAIGERLPPGGTVALVHATSYTDDRQVMAFLARRFERRGLRAMLAAPDHIRWQDGHADVEAEWFSGRADFVFRFFPAEWLPNLGRRPRWGGYFGGGVTPLCNPGTALLSQSKRWPLVCRQLGLRLPGWEEWCPETADPRDIDWRGNREWVLKPALGRVGDSVGICDVTGEREWKAIRRSVRWRPRHWVAQRRFASQPVRARHGKAADTPDIPWHVCLGVYTVNGKAAGVYGRIAERPLINHLAREAAVLVEKKRGASESFLDDSASGGREFSSLFSKSSRAAAASGGMVRQFVPS